MSFLFLPVATFAAVSYQGGRTGPSGIVASGFMAVFYVPPAGSLMLIDIGSIGNIALYIALALGVVYAIYRFRARFGLMSPIMSASLRASFRQTAEAEFATSTPPPKNSPVGAGPAPAANQQARSFVSWTRRLTRASKTW